MSRNTIEIGDAAFIYEGAKLRIRWMRYQHDFPARSFLEGYPEDFAQFLWRAEEMARTGTIFLPSQGHPLKGPYRELFQFNMALTRSWGFHVSNSNVFVIVDADTKKKAKEQETDYKRALALRADYIDRIEAA